MKIRRSKQLIPGLNRVLMHLFDEYEARPTKELGLKIDVKEREFFKHWSPVMHNRIDKWRTHYREFEE